MDTMQTEWQPYQLVHLRVDDRKRPGNSAFLVKEVDYWARHVCISLNSIYFKIEVITRNIIGFYEDKATDRTSYS